MFAKTQEVKDFQKFYKPIPIETRRGYWGDMWAIANNKDWEACAVVNLVGCTYSEEHQYDLIPITQILPYAKT
jgi:hypothetical protein